MGFKKMFGMTFSKLWKALNDDEKFSFIESNYRLRTAHGNLIENWHFTDKQKEWYKEGILFKEPHELKNRILLKSRGIGATFILESLESLIGVQIYPNVFVPIAAGREEQAILPISYIKQLIKDCKYPIGLSKPIHLQADSYITFKEGAIIKAFPGGNPEGLHGPRGLWGYIDEFARARYQNELLQAFNYFFSEGGQLSLLSTAYGKNNEHWRILQKFKELRYKRFDMLIFNNMADFDITKSLTEQTHLGLEWTWLDLEKLDGDRIRDPIDFRQQMAGDPVEEITQWFPDELTHNPPILNKELQPCSQPEINDVWIGALDVAARVNQTALVDGKVIFRQGLMPKLSVRNEEIITGDYTTQKNKVISKIKTMKYRYFSPDETGLGGINWVSELRKECRSTIIKGITYGGKDWCDDNTQSNNKEAMMTISKTLMQDSLVEIPDNSLLLEQLSRVERTITQTSRQYSGKQGGKYDDDVVMAFCQLCLLFYRMFIKNYALKAEIKGIDVYPRTSITRGVNYQKRMRFL